tara:strand:- start:5085 stop:5966 length:882 start_codon:yes stop_codon:yes gene_type:complete
MDFEKKRKGIILAGGTGSRLFPITKGVSKQLVPVYDKPMIYYPLTTLMNAGIKDFLLITNKEYMNSFESLLGDGNQFGISIEYAIQDNPNGIAEAFLIGEDFIKGNPVALILGDNLFNGEQLDNVLKNISDDDEGGIIFGYSVSNPEDYGVAELDSKNRVINITEKPSRPLSKWAITGLYFYDKTIIQKAKKIKPSNRGELEITDLNNLYIKEGSLKVELMRPGTAWLDTGNPDSLLDAGSYIKTLEKRQGLKVGCPEELAWRLGYINNRELEEIANKLIKTSYGKYLKDLIS